MIIRGSFLPLLVAFGLGHWQQALAQTAPLLVTEGMSPHFQAVSSKLELGGASFLYAEQEDTWGAVAELMDGALKNLPAAERAALPANLSFREMLSLLGVDRLKASGASSRLLPDGRYHSLSFAYAPEGRTGFMTLSGGPAEPFLLHALAPADTDLVLEFPLHTRDFTKETLPAVEKLMPEIARAQTDAALDQMLPIGLSNRALLEKLSARIALIARLNPDQSFPSGQPGVTLPGIDAALVIERLDWLLEPLKQQFMPMISSPEAPVTVTEKEGILTIQFRTPMGPPPMDFQPSLRYDARQKRLIVATRPAYLAALLSPEGKMVNAPEFKQAWQGMPEAGNGCLYLSPRFFTSLIAAAKQSMDASPNDAQARAAAMPLIDRIAVNLKQPQAYCYANLPDGTAGTANSIIPFTGNSSPLATITTISILSSLAVPTFNVIHVMADQTTATNSGRQVAMSLKIYANDHNSAYPAKLQDLIKTHVMEDDRLLTVKDPATKISSDWLYDATLTTASPGSSILLASPFAYGSRSKQKRAVVRNDLTAEIIDEATFSKQRSENLK